MVFLIGRLQDRVLLCPSDIYLFSDVTRITIQEILENEWFQKGYRPPDFKQENEVKLDDVDAVFNDSEEHLVTEKKERPASMNAFELISSSGSFDLGNLFEKQMQDALVKTMKLIIADASANVSSLDRKHTPDMHTHCQRGHVSLYSVLGSNEFSCKLKLASNVPWKHGLVKRETRFTSQRPPNEIMSKIEEAAKPLGFNVRKQNYKMKLRGDKTGRKGHLSVATEVFEVAPSLHMVELRKTGGDTLEFHNLLQNGQCRDLYVDLRGKEKATIQLHT
ncbi:Non-specific serine threonine protein kinase [Asimina triloba]